VEISGWLKIGVAGGVFVLAVVVLFLFTRRGDR
jgi:hypothetical protein